MDVHEQIRRVLDESALSGQVLASDAGVSIDALWSWTGGRRNPSPESIEKLAGGLERRAKRLRELATELRDGGHDRVSDAATR